MKKKRFNLWVWGSTWSVVGAVGVIVPSALVLSEYVNPGSISNQQAQKPASENKNQNDTQQTPPPKPQLPKPQQPRPNQKKQPNPQIPPPKQKEESAPPTKPAEPKPESKPNDNSPSIPPPPPTTRPDVPPVKKTETQLIAEYYEQIKDGYQVTNPEHKSKFPSLFEPRLASVGIDQVNLWIGKQGGIPALPKELQEKNDVAAFEFRPDDVHGTMSLKIYVYKKDRSLYYLKDGSTTKNLASGAGKTTVLSGFLHYIL